MKKKYQKAEGGMLTTAYKNYMRTAKEQIKNRIWTALEQVKTG